MSRVDPHLEITSTREQAAKDWAEKAGEKAASSPVPSQAWIEGNQGNLLSSQLLSWYPSEKFVRRFFRQTIEGEIYQTYLLQLYFRNISKDTLA